MNRAPIIYCVLAFLLATASPHVAAEDPPAAEVPPVLLTETHQKHCRLRPGDAFPAMKLPRLDGQEAALAKLQGKQATVVILWGRDYWMTRAALSDLAKDVPRLFENKPVALVGVAVGHTPATANPVLAATGAKFPQLLDAEGQAVAKVTAAVLPQIYVLDGTGKVAWFDIEYSESTRRELQQTLEALLK